MPYYELEQNPLNAEILHKRNFKTISWSLLEKHVYRFCISYNGIVFKNSK